VSTGELKIKGETPARFPATIENDVPKTLVTLASLDEIPREND
jgi:hypothetical protein